MTFRPPIALLLLGSALLLLGSGCQMEERVISSSFDDLKKLEWYDPSGGAKNQDTSGPNAARNRGYAIELGRFSGDDAYAQVYRVITDARQEAGLANLWYAATGRETIVYAGRFRDKDDAEVNAMLRTVRRAQIHGNTPFEDAKVVAISSSQRGVADKRDLRSLSGRGLYALQIGYFDRSFGNDYRKAAETAVDVLREQGEEAYYYHGPNRSLVLVNAWKRSEAFTRVGTTDRYSNAVRTVQEKHPYNVPNGKPFTAADDPGFVASQHSFLVPIR